MSSIDVESPVVACPDAGALKAFHLGELPSATVEQIGDHLSTCPACGSALEQLDQSPLPHPIFKRLRQSFRPNPILEEEGLARLERIAMRLDRSTLADSVPAPAGRMPRTTSPILTEIGAYKLLAKIGQGGMGTVYRALQRPVNREVALKVILGGTLAGPDAVARFRREGQAIARLKHANVVQIHEFGEHDGLPFFSMELVEGGSLSARLAPGPLPWRTAARIVADLAHAVEVAHQHHVVHRDLKPSNILLTEHGVPKISDFGLAKLADDDDTHTRSQAVLGTPAYMAPEQAEGRIDSVGPSVDIYALGVILYEALTGRPPFRGASRDQTLTMVRAAVPMPPSRLCPGLPPDLEAICLKCLEKSPDRRYANSAELAKDLERVLRGEPTRARPARWPARFVRAIRRHPIVAMVLFGTLIGVIAAYRLDPRRDLDALQANLDRGERTVLIGKTGEPRWSRCVNGQGRSKVVLNADDTLSIVTDSLCLLELLPDPRSDHYCVHAKVKHQMSNPVAGSGAAGLYIGRRAVPGLEADIHVFLDMSFNDQWTLKDTSPWPHLLPAADTTTNPVVWGIHLYGGYRDGGTTMLDSHARVGGPRFTPKGPAAGWHDLAIIVAPTIIRGTWDGEALLDLPLAQFAANVGSATIELAKRDPSDTFVNAVPSDLDVRGGLGLYVRYGSASFREVSVTPLSD